MKENTQKRDYEQRETKLIQLVLIWEKDFLSTKSYKREVTIKQGMILLKDALNSLCNQDSSIRSNCLSYYDMMDKMYIHLGNLEFEGTIEINQFAVPCSALFKNDKDENVLKLKLRPFKSSVAELLIQQLKQQYPQCGERKQKNVQFVLKCVSIWRRLYSGIIESDNKLKKYGLEEAANMIGISKKTLDDYLKQIRKAKVYGYDFQSFKNKPMGHLRACIKKNMKDK